MKQPSENTAKRPEQTEGPACDRCGDALLAIHCKLICRRCGFMRDCSDP